MPWKETTVMGQRADLAQEMLRRGRPVREIAAKFGVSRVTAYRWLGRFRREGLEGMADGSRRPLHSPKQTAPEVEARICRVREAHPTWGSDKVHRRLVAAGVEGLCSARTVARVLKRRGYVSATPRREQPLTRFERERPNELWQLDFKRAWYLSERPPVKAVPMTLLDDHSRFALALGVHPDRQLATVWSAIWAVFGEYGLPEAILTDNDTLFRGHRGGITAWTARLWRLGIRHLSGRTYHPQTQGKVERLHGTIARDVFQQRPGQSLPELQQALDAFREVYNHERPHAGLNLQVPADHYAPSPRARPAQLPPVEYPPGAVLRKVWANGAIKVRNCRIHVGEGIAGEYVQLTDHGERLQIEYAGQVVRRLAWSALHPDHWV